MHEGCGRKNLKSSKYTATVLEAPSGGHSHFQPYSRATSSQWALPSYHTQTWALLPTWEGHRRLIKPFCFFFFSSAMGFWFCKNALIPFMWTITGLFFRATSCCWFHLQNASWLLLTTSWVRDFYMYGLLGPRLLRIVGREGLISQRPHPIMASP